MKQERFETKNYDRVLVLVDVFEMAWVGGEGTLPEVASHLVQAIEEYNDRNGTKLILRLDQS